MEDRNVPYALACRADQKRHLTSIKCLVRVRFGRHDKTDAYWTFLVDTTRRTHIGHNWNLTDANQHFSEASAPFFRKALTSLVSGAGLAAFARWPGEPTQSGG